MALGRALWRQDVGVEVGDGFGTDEREYLPKDKVRLKARFQGDEKRQKGAGGVSLPPEEQGLPKNRTAEAPTLIEGGVWTGRGTVSARTASPEDLEAAKRESYAYALKRLNEDHDQSMEAASAKEAEWAEAEDKGIQDHYQKHRAEILGENDNGD